MCFWKLKNKTTPPNGTRFILGKNKNILKYSCGDDGPCEYAKKKKYCLQLWVNCLVSELFLNKILKIIKSFETQKLSFNLKRRPLRAVSAHQGTAVAE